MALARDVDHHVRRRANDAFDYCRLPQSASPLRFPIDHVIARHHAGPSTEENLALCCGRCNRHKGPNIAGVDPMTGAFTPLFHPRRDDWAAHFRWTGAIVEGITPTGRVTVIVLNMNDPRNVALRQELIAEGVFPPPP